MRHYSLTTTALALALSLGGGLAAFAQDAPAPANGPGPATQPPPAPGTTQPGPTQPAAPPAATGTSPAPAAPATPPPNYNIQYNGLIDGYYQFQFSNPQGQGVITGRAYDIRHNTPTLSLAELNVFENPKPGGLGFKATLITGDTADINHGAVVGTDAAGNLALIHNDSGEGRLKNIQQLYGTYAFAGQGGGIDVGKFYTPFGYEVTESNGNYNYSRSVAYNYVPFYHAGARIYTPSIKGLVATAYIVKAIFNTQTTGVQDNNKQPAFIGQLNYTDPAGKFTAISEIGLGKDKFGDTNTKVVLNDNNFTYNFNANMLAGIDYVYRKFTPDNSGPKETTNAYAVYYRQQVTPKTAYAVRFSGANDKLEGADSYKPNEITLTYELKPAANFTTRLEFRHDHSSANSSSTTPNPGAVLFADRNGNLTKSGQDTLTLAGIFTF